MFEHVQPDYFYCAYGGVVKALNNIIVWFLSAPMFKCLKIELRRWGKFE
jgi:hypothetical protein